MKRLLPWSIALLLLGSFGACSKREGSSAGGGHAHRAPHGGTLVELGEHAYNLELVRDDSGKLTAYVLDGHAENFIRIPAPAIEVVASPGGEKKSLTLRAVANPATGETVGDTSQFEAQADWLKGKAEIPATIPALEIRGAKFSNVALKIK